MIQHIRYWHLTESVSLGACVCHSSMASFTQHHLYSCRTTIQGSQNKFGKFLEGPYALTLSNINQFSKLFHYVNPEKIGKNTITKDPNPPQVCYYTTL